MGEALSGINKFIIAIAGLLAAILTLMASSPAFRDWVLSWLAGVQSQPEQPGGPADGAVGGGNPAAPASEPPDPPPAADASPKTPQGLSGRAAELMRNRVKDGN